MRRWWWCKFDNPTIIKERDDTSESHHDGDAGDDDDDEDDDENDNVKITMRSWRRTVETIGFRSHSARHVLAFLYQLWCPCSRRLQGKSATTAQAKKPRLLLVLWMS